MSKNFDDILRYSRVLRDKAIAYAEDAARVAPPIPPKLLQVDAINKVQKIVLLFILSFHSILLLNFCLVDLSRHWLGGLDRLVYYFQHGPRRLH
jgi:hypothetical protein